VHQVGFIYKTVYVLMSTQQLFSKLYDTIKPRGKCGRSQACIVDDGTYKNLREVQVV